MRRKADIRAQLVARYPRDPLNVRQALSGHFIPHGNCRRFDADFPRNLGDQSARLSYKGHSVHGATLSQTEHVCNGKMLRKAYYNKGHHSAMDLSNVIREGRRKAGLSQRALADKLSVAPSAVAQWETGATNPSIPNRVDLAAALSIPFSNLIPEFSGGDHISSRNPQTVALVRRFEGLPAPVRESILMQVVATADALSSGTREPPVKK